MDFASERKIRNGLLLLGGIVLLLSTLSAYFVLRRARPDLRDITKTSIANLTSYSTMYYEANGSWPIAPGPEPKAHESINLLIGWLDENGIGYVDDWFHSTNWDRVPTATKKGSLRLTEATCAFLWINLQKDRRDGPFPIVGEKRLRSSYGKRGMYVGFSDGSVHHLSAYGFQRPVGLGW